MIEDRFIELMNQEIDGVNSPSQSDELRRFLESSSEGRRYYDELRGVTRVLEEAGPLAVPGELRHQILSRLHPHRPHPRTKTPFFDAIRERLRPKYVYAFAVGLIAGICLYAVFFNYSGDRSHLNRESLYGTIALGQAEGTPSSSIPVEMDFEGITGEAVFDFFNQALVARIKLKSVTKIDLVFEYPDDISFEAFRTLVDAGHSLQSSHGSLMVTNEGVSDFVVVFKEPASAQTPLLFRVLSGGNVVFEKTVEPGRK